LNTTNTQIPEAFIAQSTAIYAETNDFIKALDTDPITSIRINSSKLPPLHNLTQVSWCSTGYYLSNRPAFTLDPILHGGGYYVQEASSMFLEQITQLIDRGKTLKILDLCAAPGGKTTHLFELFPNSIIVSNEIIRSRAKILAENCTKWGNCNSIITNSEPAQLGKLTGQFDIIVIDAPCSGEGMFRKDPTSRSEWSLANVDNCYLRQRDIVTDILPALKEGGLLIYSTCTFNTKENDENVDYFVKNYDLQVLNLPLLPDQQITQTPNGYQFYPHKTIGEGFFISFLQKQSPSPTLRIKNIRSNTLTQFKSSELTPLISSKNELINPDSYLTFMDTIHLFPSMFHETLLLLQEHVRIVQFGTKVGKFMKNKLHPEHDLALCHQIELSGFEVENLGYEDAVNYLRKQPFSLTSKKEGWCIIQYESIPLGWIKAMENRFNNYYPTDWRIYNTQLTGKFSLIE
jgi:16S rRNA C967 or C1407 C5-methylase (RsmB/RsmF family)/NOL1/NOP2/fmu family ribosome biogenesis protein